MEDYSDIHIEWQSEITAKMGYGLQTRRMLRPLIEKGAKIKFIPDEDYLPAHMKIDDPFWNDQLRKSQDIPDAPIRVCYCLPQRYKPAPNKINIGYTMWETDRYPRQWVSHINKVCNYFFAGCNSLVESAKSGGINVPVIPINATLDINEWSPDGPKLAVNEIPENDVKFLFIGNFIPRKNLEELLLGFAVAFENVRDVSLIIKTWSAADTPQSKKHISDSIRHLYNKAVGLTNKPKVSVITDILDENRMIELIRGTDAYVSVSKGEGFDLPMMQAMALEKKIVTTRFLAHGDYLTDDNSVNVPYTLMPCVDAAAPLYDSYQMWSRPDMKEYIRALQLTYTLIRNSSNNHLGKNARQTIKDKYSVEANTPVIAKTLRDIRDNKYAPQTRPTKDLIKELVLETGPR